MKESREGQKLIGLITDIQRFSIHDGPGIRTLVFLKGCPLRCVWCDNPETQIMEQQIMFDESKGVRSVVGKQVSVDEVVREVARDSIFYRNSGGGVTISGGEPTAQPEFVRELARSCRQGGFHVALETSGYTTWVNMKSVTESVDIVLYDIKHMNEELHREFTGVSNQLILENARRLALKKIPMIIRVPVIPGYNDSEQNMKETAELARELQAVSLIELLPYHRLGQQKYERLGWEYQCKASPPTREHMEKLRKIIESSGISAKAY